MNAKPNTDWLAGAAYGRDAEQARLRVMLRPLLQEVFKRVEGQDGRIEALVKAAWAELGGQ